MDVVAKRRAVLVRALSLAAERMIGVVLLRKLIFAVIVIVGECLGVVVMVS